MTVKNQRHAVQQDTAPSHQQTMATIRAGMKILGDLPIFSTSINKIRRISSDPSSDAMAVAQEVLKDANLSTKLLRLGNSAHYNRGVGKISVVSRAVIVLGFETVKNLTLTLKLIESFQTANPVVDMSKMLVKSYLAAGFVRDIADKCGIKDVEESYVCALLYNLGEITVAYVMPNEYQRISELVLNKGLSQAEAEQTVLGTSISLISQELATTWEFPPTVVSAMAPPPSKITRPIKDHVSFNRSIASLAHQLLDNLYSATGEGDHLTDTLEMIAKATGLNDGMVENYLNESFRMSCALATEYGLNKKSLKPQLGDGEGTLRNKWARQLSYYASTEEPGSAANPDKQTTSTAKAETISPSKDTLGSPKGADSSNASLTSNNVSSRTNEAALPNQVSNPPDDVAPLSGANHLAQAHFNAQLQLQIIQEITELMAKSARLSEVFVKVVDGLHRGAGFDRVLLCLVTPDRRNYVGRLAAGAQREVLKQYFSFPIDPSSDLFSKTLNDGGELLVNNTADAAWGNLLPSKFVEVIKADSFIVAALRYQEKAVGFFYADCAVSGRLIDEADRRNLLQFVTQARLALRLCT